MKTRSILILCLKFFAIIAITLVVTFIMAMLLPPPKGTAFDGLNYILKPVYVSAISAIIYFVLSVAKQTRERNFFYAALLASTMYVVLLYLRII